MAILNYADQFKYTGKGYIDSKLEPKKNLSELNSMNVLQLAKFYTPGMKVVVLDDGLGYGPSEYILTKEYKWERFDKNNEIKSLSEKLLDIIEQNQITSNKVDEIDIKVETLSDKLAKISGIDKIKAGENVKLTSEDDGYLKIDIDLTNISTDNVVVDDKTISQDENKMLSVKISQKEGNALIKEEDGLFSQGIFITGDDNEEIE